VKSITVGLLPDAIAESDETFTVTLQNASAGTELGDGVTTVTIRDDDSTSTPNPGPAPGSDSGGRRGGGGSEHPFTLLLYACVLALARLHLCRMPRPVVVRPDARGGGAAASSSASSTPLL
jgi:hypothetical protein